MSAPGPVFPAERNIGAEVRELVSSVVKMANYLGDTAAADLLTSQAATADTTATIVVAGEAKQGKSTLVNALIGADLSPVDVDVATAAPVRIAYGPEPSAVLTLVTGDRLTIPPAELAEWISMAGADLDRLRQVGSAEVEVPSPLLAPGVVLVDTPGVGGLVAGHAAMTLRALESATAMLFVTDADALLTRPELDFLARAGERLAAVIFVLTKTDLAPDWKAVLAENRQVLATHAPRYADAPVVAVSARLAARARAVADTDRPLSANLWAESGLGQLQGWITSRIRPVATTLAVANTVALTRGIVDRLGATAQRSLDAATADPAVAAAFQAEQARVAALRSDQSTWSTMLERRLFEARTDLRDQIKRSTEDLRRSLEERLRTAKSRDTKQLIAQVDADLDAQAQDVSAALDETTRTICAQMLAALDIASPLELSTGGTGHVQVKVFERGTTNALNALTAGLAASSGWTMVSRIVVGMGMKGTLATVALPLAGAVGVGYLIQHVRGGAASRAELRGWVRAEVDRAAAERYADMERVLTRMKLDIMDVVRAGLLEREREVSAALEEAKAARTRSEQERVARERNLRNLLEAARKRTAVADELLRALLTAASLTAPNVTAGRAVPA